MAIKFVASVKSEDLSRCIDSISIFDSKARLGVENALRKGTRRVAAGAKRRVAVRSGTLKKSIRSGFKAEKMLGTVRAKTPYAHLVEFGAKAVTVKPKKKKKLGIPFADAVLPRAKAKIPKRKAKPFIFPAYEAEEKKIIKEIKENITHVATSK